MVKRLTTRLVIFLCAWALPSCDRSENTPADDAKVSIEVVRKVTKGFPVVLRLSFRGPQRAPRLSVFDDLGGIAVRLVSKSDGSQYVISSSRRMEITVIGSFGELREDIAEDVSSVSVEEKQQRSMLLDVFALRPELGKGTLLDDLPPGDYAISVELPASDEKSNSLDIELVAPSVAEQEFLAHVNTKGVFRRGTGVNWAKCLPTRVELPKEALRGLEPNTRIQMQFHVLLLCALRAEVSSRREAESSNVPDYLLAEKECLLLELDALTENNGLEEKRKTLRRRHPDVAWRLQEGAGFLRYRAKKR